MDFTDLKALVTFLDKTKVNQLEIFTREDFYSSKSKMGRVFQAVKENQFEDFEQLQFFLNDQKNNKWGFKKLIFRFKEKLINTLVFVDTNSPIFNERTKAYYECTKRTLLVRMLFERGIKTLAIEIATYTIEITVKYEFTEFTLMLSRFLMRQYSSTILDFKKFKKYLNLFNKSFNANVKENSVEEMSCALRFKNNSNKQNVFNEQIIKNLDDVVFKVIKIVEDETPTVELINNCSTIILEYFKEKRDFGQFKYWTNFFVQCLFSKPFLSVLSLELLIISQLRITLLTKDYITANNLSNNYFEKFNIGYFNWYVSNLYFILTMFHSGKYTQAISKLKTILNFKTFQKQPPVIQENFYVLQAFASFLIKIKKVNEDLEIEFRINKFLNQVPSYSRDKQGINIPIILVQILYFLAEKKYSKIIDRMESLNLYSYRHLKKDENFRSQCFIKMISEMVKADFRKQGTLFRTEKLLNKLKAVPIDTYPATAETEIIPYEDLWEMVIERLD